MSTTLKLLAVLGLVATVSACSRQSDDDFVTIDPEPISTEPMQTGKFK